MAQTAGFDPSVPVERARTPPASWYTDPSFHERERRELFPGTWQAAARLDQLRRPGDFVSGDVAGQPYLVLRDDEGVLRAFFNVCRHHAACIVSGAGSVDRLTCPYHGWSYDLQGRLRKAPRLGGVRGFDRERFGLRPMEVGSWGPFVFIRACGGAESLEQTMRPLDGRLDWSSLRFAARRSYELACNWKVFVDNYLDGGYHVGELHRGLASQLDLGSYRTELAGRISLQLCDAGGAGAGEGVEFGERLRGGAVYAFVYPNFMINRYGPMMDTNWALPLGHDRTLTIFDYYFDERVADDAAFVERSLEASDRVQVEDVEICESVQRGLGSLAYDTGIYAPGVEQAAHRFHCLLARDLAGAG